MKPSDDPFSVPFRPLWVVARSKGGESVPVAYAAFDELCGPWLHWAPGLPASLRDSYREAFLLWGAFGDPDEAPAPWEFFPLCVPVPSFYVSPSLAFADEDRPQ